MWINREQQNVKFSLNYCHQYSDLIQRVVHIIELMSRELFEC